jgi:dihydropteroate synthase
MFTLNCKGKILTINDPIVMGIINATPDSFYEGYLNLPIEEILQLAEKMIKDGATILDIGGQSTRPNSEKLTWEEEAGRVLPVIEAINKIFPTVILSIDTYYHQVAELAIEAGCSIINDVSAGNLDNEMLFTAGKLKVPYIAMHMQGTPQNMQNNPAYSDVSKELLEFFTDKINQCEQAKINDIIIDPGFGFGKTTAHNFKLLKDLNIFSILKKPILAGLSRKGMIHKTLGITAKEALNGTTALNMLALQNGANILRVHDVKEAMEVVLLYNTYKNAAL